MLMLTLSMTVAWAGGAWHGVRHDRPTSPSALESHVPSASPTAESGWANLPFPLIEEPEVDEAPDLYGNDVAKAIAQYKSDAGGSLYEEHSPSTEVTRLRPKVG
jgi:hypothetical protein